VPPIDTISRTKGAWGTLFVLSARGVCAANAARFTVLLNRVMRSDHFRRLLPERGSVEGY